MRESFCKMSAFDPVPEDVDREIRIEKMKRELDDLAAGSMISGSFADVPPNLEEAFLGRVCEFEKAPYDTNFNRLVQCGVEMIPPAELDKTNLHSKLQEVLGALATVHCFLEQTDHLSERELYTWLWSDALREETPDLSHLGWAWHISPIGGCDEQDVAIFLKLTTPVKGDGVSGRRNFRATLCRCTVRCLTIATRIRLARSRSKSSWRRDAFARSPRRPLPRKEAVKGRPSPESFRGWVLATSYSRTTYRRTTIGAAAFHFRVRNGNGWCHCAMITRRERRRIADLFWRCLRFEVRGLI